MNENERDGHFILSSWIFIINMSGYKGSTIIL